MAVLEIKNLKKSYDDNTILNNISLNVEKGEVIVILGPSGCGKSTLLRCINGLETIQGGEISLDGEVISNIKGAGIPGAGTFGYKPPEFRSGSASLAKLDERADIYTLGATLYHLLRCKPLTEELKTEDTIIPIERLMEMGYLDETANIIKKCTEYRKEDRYKNVMEVRAAILKNMELIRRNML